jgi:2'-5' RNA ligase
VTAPASHRLFFAQWPDAPSSEALRRLALDVAAQRGGRAPGERNLHVTLAFLGNVGGQRIEALAAIGEACARGCTAFTLTLDALGGTSQGIAWLAPGVVPPQLASFHASLAASLATAGFAIERRRFRPHVTLARHCAKPARRGSVDPIAWRVDRLALVASTPGQGGSRYADLATWPLAEVASA